MYAPARNRNEQYICENLVAVTIAIQEIEEFMQPHQKKLENLRQLEDALKRRLTHDCG